MNKPGYKTTEFWVTVIVQVMGVIAALGLVTPEQADTLTQAAVQLGGIVVMVLGAFGYNKSRGIVKSSEAHAESMKMMNPPPAAKAAE